MLTMLRNGQLSKEDTYRVLLLGLVMGCILLFTIFMAAFVPDPFEGFCYGIILSSLLILTAPFVKAFAQKHAESFETFYLYHCMALHVILNVCFVLLNDDAYTDSHCGDKTAHRSDNNRVVKAAPPLVSLALFLTAIILNPMWNRRIIVS